MVPNNRFWNSFFKRTLKSALVFHCYQVNDCSNKKLIITGSAHYLRQKTWFNELCCKTLSFQTIIEFLPFLKQVKKVFFFFQDQFKALLFDFLFLRSFQKAAQKISDRSRL